MTREEQTISNLKKLKSFHNGSYGTDIDRAIKALEQEPKTGQWIIHPKGIYAHLICDNCLSNAPYDCRTNYCPNCGCHMIEPQESENNE